MFYGNIHIHQKHNLEHNSYKLLQVNLLQLQQIQQLILPQIMVALKLKLILLL